MTLFLKIVYTFNPSGNVLANVPRKVSKILCHRSRGWEVGKGYCKMQTNLINLI